MAPEPFYKDHWINIEPARLERYQRMFQWNPASFALYEPAEIGAGHVVADFGCGPGYTAIEIAAWVGPQGHVHALDINAGFVARARANAEAAGLSERVSVHRCDDMALPLPDQSLDRLTARNTIIYVDDPAATMAEFRRVLKPGGKVHTIEGDWQMMVLEPVPAADWAALVAAASNACHTPDIGRRLYGLMGEAGFSDIEVRLITRPDTDGRLLPMIKTLADYARASGRMDEGDIDRIVAMAEAAVADKSYLMLAPQFVVTATR